MLKRYFLAIYIFCFFITMFLIYFHSINSFGDFNVYSFQWGSVDYPKSKSLEKAIDFFNLIILNRILITIFHIGLCLL